MATRRVGFLTWAGDWTGGFVHIVEGVLDSKWDWFNFDGLFGDIGRANVNMEFIIALFILVLFSKKLCDFLFIAIYWLRARDAARLLHSLNFWESQWRECWNIGWNFVHVILLFRLWKRIVVLDGVLVGWKTLAYARIVPWIIFNQLEYRFFLFFFLSEKWLVDHPRRDRSLFLHRVAWYIKERLRIVSTSANIM